MEIKKSVVNEKNMRKSVIRQRELIPEFSIEFLKLRYFLLKKNHLIVKAYANLFIK